MELLPKKSEMVVSFIGTAKALRVDCLEEAGLFPKGSFFVWVGVAFFLGARAEICVGVVEGFLVGTDSSSESV